MMQEAIPREGAADVVAGRAMTMVVVVREEGRDGRWKGGPDVLEGKRRGQGME